MSQFLGVSIASPCASCGCADWCARSSDGNVEICRRQQSDGWELRTDKARCEFYLRVVSRTNSVSADIAPPEPVWREEKASPDVLTAAYEALMKQPSCALNAAALGNLHARGLTNDEIEDAGYFIIPPDAGGRRDVAAAVQQEIGADTILHVPGFFLRDGDPELHLAEPGGLAIPCRNVDGAIVAIRVRTETAARGSKPATKRYLWLSAPKGVDVQGCGPGAPCHVPHHDAAMRLDDIRVTEGELKADIATLRTGVLTIGIPGVAMWPRALPVLKALGARRVHLAFDGDARTNRHVAQPLQRFASELTKAGYEVVVEVWHQRWKGIDDALTHAEGGWGAIEQHVGREAWEQIEKIVAESGAPPDPAIAARAAISALHERLKMEPNTATASAFEQSVIHAGAVLKSSGLQGEYEELIGLLKKAKVRTTRWEAAVESEVRRMRKKPSEVAPTGRTRGWREMLSRNQFDAIDPSLSNCLLALQFAPEWEGVLGFDEFNLRVALRRAPPWAPEYAPAGGSRLGPWTDEDDTRLVIWFEREIAVSPRAETVREAVRLAADQSRFHPVRDDLLDLRWDGRPRLDTWLADYLGSKQGPEYLRRVGRWFLIATVRRVFEPGSKSDYTVVLEGEQGTNKTTIVEILARRSEWFASLSTDIGTKDAMQYLHGKLIVELAELASLGRAAVEKVKAYLTEKTDHYRPPYARRPIDVPRQNVFIATTNANQYLIDDTGNRRFWPVRCTATNFDQLRRDRDQLYAEAVMAYQAGERSWPVSEDAPLFQAEQEEREVGDAWESGVWTTLERYVAEGRTFVNNSELIFDATGKFSKDQTRADQMRIAAIARKFGCRNGRDRTPGAGRLRGWHLPEAPPALRPRLHVVI